MTPSITSLLLLVLGLMASCANGFLNAASRRTVIVKPVVTRQQQNHPALKPPTDAFWLPNDNARRNGSVACFMYNLPPGRNKNDNGLGDVIKGVLVFGGLIAFFASPLGALFFALFNSLLAIAFLLPVGAIVAFQVWQFLNTTQGACPSCSAPLRILKDGSPSICLNCGSIVQAGPEDKIEISPQSSTIFIEEDDSLFGGFLDSNWGSTRRGENQTDQERRERTIIDVEIERDDRK